MSDATMKASARFTNLLARRFPALGRSATARAGREVPLKRRPEGQHDRRSTGVPPRRRRPLQRRATPHHADARAPRRRPRGRRMAGGSDTTPNWYKNLLTAGSADVQVGAERWSVTARELDDGAERGKCWSLANGVYPGFDSYQRFTERQIPVAVLERRAG